MFKRVALAFAGVVAAWLACLLVMGVAATVAFPLGSGPLGMAVMMAGSLAGGSAAGLGAWLVARRVWPAPLGVAGVWAMMAWLPLQLGWHILDWYIAINVLGSLAAAVLVAWAATRRQRSHSRAERPVTARR